MKFSSKLMAVLFLLVATYTPHTFAGDAVAIMAKIVSSLQHFPNEADKEALTAIVAGDSGDSIKAVAAAIAGISHKVSDSDKVVLEAIVKSDAESARLRELASIVVGVNHMPSSSAKSALAALSN